MSLRKKLDFDTDPKDRQTTPREDFGSLQAPGYKYSRRRYGVKKSSAPTKRMINTSEMDRCGGCNEPSMVIIDVGIIKPIYDGTEIVDEEFDNVQNLCNACLQQYYKPLIDTHKVVRFFFPGMVFCEKEKISEIEEYVIKKGRWLKEQEEIEEESALVGIENLSC
jgi:hypothetical protein